MKKANRVVIGVTGHRKLGPDAVFVEALRSVIENIIKRASSATGIPPALVVLSSLAEGADRLVAREVLKVPGSCLVVVLPMESDDYIKDFKTGQSKAAYQELFARAVHVEQLPAKDTRVEAYEQAGQYIVDNCDVLIALWDGRPATGRGGTGEIVQYARENKRPVVWIYPDKAKRVSWELGLQASLLSVTFKMIDSYLNGQ